MVAQAPDRPRRTLEYRVGQIPQLEAEIARLSAEITAIDAEFTRRKALWREHRLDEMGEAEYQTWKRDEDGHKLAISARYRDLTEQLKILRRKRHFRELNGARAAFARASSDVRGLDARQLLGMCLGALQRQDALGYLEHEHDQRLVYLVAAYLEDGR